MQRTQPLSIFQWSIVLRELHQKSIKDNFCNIASKNRIYHSTLFSFCFIVFLEISLKLHSSILRIFKYQTLKIKRIHFTFKLQVNLLSNCYAIFNLKNLKSISNFKG